MFLFSEVSIFRGNDESLIDRRFWLRRKNVPSSERSFRIESDMKCLKAEISKRKGISFRAKENPISAFTAMNSVFRWIRSKKRFSSSFLFYIVVDSRKELKIMKLSFDGHFCRTIFTSNQIDENEDFSSQAILNFDRTNDQLYFYNGFDRIWILNLNGGILHVQHQSIDRRMTKFSIFSGLFIFHRKNLKKRNFNFRLKIKFSKFFLEKTKFESTESFQFSTSSMKRRISIIFILCTTIDTK